MNTKSNLLSDVVIIRNILIILLVFYHAFAIYSGAWAPIKGYPEILVYWWMDKLSYAFMLELFVFVSGYVFGYQVRNKGESKLKANNLFGGKFKRLMIPCMVFSLLYIVLFQNIIQPIYKTAYDLLNGTGHMWFLPMLFWCFVGIWIIEKFHLKSKWAVLLLVLAALCSFIPLPLRIGTAMYYMLFFYMGYIIQKNVISIEWLYTKKSAIITTVSFAIIFPFLTLLKEHLGTFLWSENQIVTLLIKNTISNALMLIYSFTGIIMTLSLVGCYLKEHNFTSWMEKVGGLSFGVYLSQQFILVWLYEYTTLPSLLGCWWLPWFGFVVALFGSIIIVSLLLKTKIGKYLLG